MIESFTLSCVSLDETQADRNVDVTPEASPRLGSSFFFENPRKLGKGVDTFDAEGIPQTPTVTASSPMALDLEVAPLDLDAPAAMAPKPATRKMQMVLLRGGASFTGAHIAWRLLKAGYNVRMLAKECGASVKQLKALCAEALPPQCPNRLYVFRGDDLTEALQGCDFVVCNSDPETGDLSSLEEIEKRYVDDMHDLFLSIHSALHADRTDGGGSSVSGAPVPTRGGPPSRTSPSASLTRNPRHTIRVVWIATAAAVFPVETTSRAKERHLLAVKARVMRDVERIAKKADIPCVVLLPSIVVGPPLTDEKAEAHYMIARIAQGNRFLPLAPKMFWNFVDVRDLAEAVCAALTSDAAAGQRYLISECELSVSGIGRLVKQRFPSLHPPVLNMPNLITLLLCHLGFLGERVSYTYLKQNLNRSFVLPNHKARRDLRIQFHSASEAVVSTVAFMLQLTPAEFPRAATRRDERAHSSSSSSSSELAGMEQQQQQQQNLAASAGSPANSRSSRSSPRRRERGSAVGKGKWRRWAESLALMVAAASVSLSLGFWLGLRDGNGGAALQVAAVNPTPVVVHTPKPR